MDWTLIPKKLNVTIVVLILQLFLFVSADAIYGSQSTTAKSLLIAYMLMTISVLVFTRTTEIKGMRDTPQSLINFFIFFVASALLLLILPVGSAGFGTLKTAWGFGLIQSFVVAYSEEVMFRGVLPLYLGDIYSNILFGLFHWAVSGSIVFVLFAIAMGFVFSFVRDRWGIYASMGLHSAWNLKALGILAMLMKGTP
jgi:membrane protease YdiL (CAAX protease family)